MRIFVHLNDGDTIIEDDATRVVSSKGKINLKNASGVTLFTTRDDNVHKIEILPQLWEL